jgi:ABC-type bacteriocin/lantibiotic exporter with double-glycine peptidase domain
MNNLKKIFYLFSSKEIREGSLIVFLLMIMAIIDMLGVASILPFMAVLTNPNLIETNYHLGLIYDFSKIFGVNGYQDFTFFLGIIVFVTLVLSLLFKAFTSYLQIKFVQMCEHTFSKRLIEVYLNQPYEWYLSKNSSDLGKNILSEVTYIIGNGIYPIMEFISKGFICISIISLLIFTNPKISIVAIFIPIFLYAFFFYFIKNFLKNLGTKRVQNNSSRFNITREAFGAIRYIKLKGLEKKYIDLYSNASKIFAKTQYSSKIISQLPKFFLEMISFGGILMILLYLSFFSKGFNEALPIISLYVYGGYRLMPALQQVYASVSSIAFIGPSLDKLSSHKKLFDTKLQNKKTYILDFKKEIKLENIKYKYPNTKRNILEDINLSIKANTKIGLIGSSGSGKSTLADIIMGLIIPQEGHLKVDNLVIHKTNLNSWQRIIGYVPQSIFLNDDTVGANICFGEGKTIDKRKVVKAAKLADLDDFVVNLLPQKYHTNIGESGIRLSGGQRQRIGIARALYNEPKILIFDEATNALDADTEERILNNLQRNCKNITLIIITHRLKTLKICDKVYRIKNKIVQEVPVNKN